MNTLFKNGQIVMWNLKRSTYIKTFEIMRLKAKELGIKFNFSGVNSDLVVTYGPDNYVLKVSK